ncbi:SDR family NAD(P)-dependent oxidoreductase [Dysosmobacter sp. Phy]
MQNLLKDKVIVITGGTKGVGRAAAIAAAAEGAKVVIAGRDAAAAEEIIGVIRTEGKGDAMFVRTDVSKAAECEHLMERAYAAYGKIDGLVNYAGILPVASILDTTEELYESIMDTNAKSAFFCAKYALRYMKPARSGSIINMGSLHAYGGEEDRAAYAVSKGAMRTLMLHIAKNYAKYHIRCNWITIGWIATPGELALRECKGGMEWINRIGSQVFPMGKIQTFEDNVAGILYLLSDYAEQVSGTELYITGGLMDASFQSEAE